MIVAGSEVCEIFEGRRRVSSDGDDRGRPTMSMAEAAKVVGLSQETVRRWVDDAETRGEPVAERERDEQGQVVQGSWRRPYRDEVVAWARRRRPAAAGEVDG